MPREASRRHTLIPFEGFYKIAQIVKTAAEGHIRYRIAGGGEEESRMLYPLVIEVIHRGFVGHIHKKATEIFGRHMGCPGHLFQGYGVLIVVVYVFQRLLELHDFLIIPQGLGRFFKIAAAGVHHAEKQIKPAEYLQLIAFGAMDEGVEYGVYNGVDAGLLQGEMMIDLGPVVNNFLNIGLAGAVLLQKCVHIKYNTLIHTGIGDSGMEDTTIDKNNFPGPGCKFFFIQGDMKRAFQDAYDFVFHMPVVRHRVLGMGFVYMIKFKGEIVGSPLFILVEM